MKCPADESSRRFNTIRASMEKEGLDVLIVYSPQWKLELMHYVSNYRILGQDACLVLPLNDEPTLYISEVWDLKRAQEESWVKEIIPAPNGMLRIAGIEACKVGKRIGVVGVEQISQDKYKDLVTGLNGTKFTNEWSLVDKLAMIKTPWEVEILRKCANLADEGFLAELRAIRAGISEYELVAEIEYAMKSRGADDNFQMVGIGRNLTGMNIARECRMVDGDLALTEITPHIGCNSYATQLCRTVKLGPATKVEKEKYNLLLEALEESLKIMKPGVKAGDVARKQNEIIGKAGYQKYCQPPYMRSRGHNFGLGQLELAEENDLELRSNMIMVVHPNQFIPETGYLACGETILITESGIDRLNRVPAKLYEV